MRKINLLIACIFGTFLSLGLSMPDSDNYEDIVYTNKSILHHILPDSVYALVNDSPVILYTRGHYGYSWSLLTKINNRINAFSGNVDPYGENNIKAVKESNWFDTCQFYQANKSIIDWGLDSLILEARKMRPVKNCEYIPISFYCKLNVFTKESDTSFDYDDSVVFSGTDSITFNQKLTKLRLFMLWLDEPNIRPYLRF